MSFFRISLIALIFCGPFASRADSGVYTFVDDRGVINLSNVPDDKRYQVLIAAPVVATIEAVREAPANPAVRQHYGAVVEQVAGQFGLEAALLHAVISVESGYNPNAVSRRGAGGLMQLMPATAKRFGVANVFDPSDNVRGGAQYLAELLTLFKNDLRLALAAYNAGENAVLKYGRKIPPYPETAAYVPKVVDFYNKLRLSM
jgi:soluble lytic murein transglycosylase-like protein